MQKRYIKDQYEYGCLDLAQTFTSTAGQQEPCDPELLDSAWRHPVQ